jgi:hypothetical protein
MDHSCKRLMSADVSFLPVGKQVSLPGHFDVSVTLEAAPPVGVRLPDGSQDVAVTTNEEAAVLAGQPKFDPA